MNFGAKQYERVRKAFKYNVRVGTVFMSVSAVVLYVFAREFTEVLSRNKDVINIAVDMLRIQCLTLPFMAYFATGSMYMQNIGRYYTALIISISRQGIFYNTCTFSPNTLFRTKGLVSGSACGRCIGFLTCGSGCKEKWVGI